MKTLRGHGLLVVTLSSALLILACGDPDPAGPGPSVAPSPRDAAHQVEDAKENAAPPTEIDWTSVVETRPPDRVRLHSPEGVDRAAIYSKLLKAFQAGGAGFETPDLFSDPLIVGPILWAAFREAEEAASLRSVPAALMVPQGSDPLCEYLDRYRIRETDEKALQAVKNLPGVILLEGRCFTGEAVPRLAAVLQGRFGPFESSRLAGLTKADFSLYWAMIPYDIERPILILLAGGRRFLLDLGKESRVTWIDDYTEWATVR